MFNRLLAEGVASGTSQRFLSTADLDVQNLVHSLIVGTYIAPLQALPTPAVFRCWWNKRDKLCLMTTRSLMPPWPRSILIGHGPHTWNTYWGRSSAKRARCQWGQRIDVGAPITGYINRVERRQQTAFTKPVTMPTNNLSQWKMICFWLAVKVQEVAYAELEGTFHRVLIVFLRKWSISNSRVTTYSDYGRGLFDCLCWPSFIEMKTSGVHGSHGVYLTIST